ncbi:MAG: hypothetical protein OXH09_10920 [Gammaproteobacteria bacterium]|nr:hypothetical protein [Gammaproteobacteria bacterium]
MPVNEHPGFRGDRVRIFVGTDELVWLYIRSGLGVARAVERAARMRHYSWLIQQPMGDQQLGDNLERNAVSGQGISVQRSWIRDDEGRVGVGGGVDQGAARAAGGGAGR